MTTADPDAAIRRPGSMARAPARAALITAAVVLLVALVAAPIAELTRAALASGVPGIAATFARPGTSGAIGHSLAVAAIVTVASLVLATAFALRVERCRPGMRGVLRVTLAAPLLIPEFVLGFAWAQAYGPAALGDQVAGFSLPGLYGPAGIVVVLTAHAMPLAYLVLTAAVAARADPDAERAARICGAGRWTTLRTVTLPILRVPLVAAGVLVFVSAMGSFAVPSVLGTPAGYATMSTLVYQDLNLAADPAAFSDVTVLALTMAVLALAAAGGADAATGSRRAAGSGPGGVAPAPRSSAGIAVTTGLYTFAAVGVPVAALALTALTRAPGLPPTPANWTASHFSTGLTGPALVALRHTLVLAGAAAIVVPVIGMLVAVVRRRTGGRAVAIAVTLAFAVPGSALAVGTMIAYGRWLTGSAAIILIAYLAKFWALGHRPIEAGLDRIPPDATRAARISGARPAAAFGTVVVPMLGPAFIAALGITFLFASHELTMSTILYGPGSQTLAVVIANQRDLGDVGSTAALAVILMVPAVFAGPLIALAWRLSRPRSRYARQRPAGYPASGSGPARPYAATGAGATTAGPS